MKPKMRVVVGSVATMLLRAITSPAQPASSAPPAPNGPPIQACSSDAYSYRNEARSQMESVIGGLKAFSAVVVIPRHPLAPGNYRATVTVNDRDYSWSFAIAPNDSRSAAR